MTATQSHRRALVAVCAGHTLAASSPLSRQVAPRLFHSERVQPLFHAASMSDRGASVLCNAFRGLHHDRS